MLDDYVYCPVNFPDTFFDARFAKKYGITEAIIFNDLYYTFSVCLKMIQHRRKNWGDNPGWIEEGGHWWMRYTDDGLYKAHEFLFDKETIGKARA